MIRAALLWSVLLAAACTPMTPERAAERCEERARAAQGPEIDLGIGANSESGLRTSGTLSISVDAMRGLDPIAVYESCVLNLTGEAPTRPPRLRAI